ncbi:MAG: hypothetical protein A2Z20_04125 [Bdellovibrionales bacterium RBG_16_40_8]|nr:MAG: hypothetical protein A2Z20_04125 [Bdellovibrionales bacterium RBG_16_40_8]
MNQKISSIHKSITLLTFLALLFTVLAASFWLMAPYIISITLGGILAIIANPIYIKLSSKKINPKLASFIVSFGIFLLVLIPLGVFIGLAWKQGLEISRAILDIDSFSIGSFIKKISNWQVFESLGINPDTIANKIHLEIKNIANYGAQKLVLIFTYLPDIFLQLILLIFSCFFLLIDGKRFLHWLSNKIPFDDHVRQKVIHSFKNTAAASILATLASSASQSMVIFFGYIILGIPGSFVAAGATFIFSWIPILGSSPISIIGAIYLYSHGQIGKALIMIVIGLIAGFIDNIVRPIVLKGRSHLHPLVSLIAIFGGINLFGISGVFLGPILAAVTISLLQAWPAIAERFNILKA